MQVHIIIQYLIYLVKIDINGSLIWQKSYGNLSFPNHEWGYDVIQLPDKGFIIAGAFGIIAVLRVPGTVCFPVVAAGSLVMTLFVTHLIWRQKISMTQKIGIGLSIVVIVLISMV